MQLVKLAEEGKSLKILELGGGDNPHPESTIRVDARSGKFTAFQQDFEQFPWTTIGDNDVDVVYGHFVMEHISFKLLPKFLGEVFRILKTGGRAVFAIPNTKAQLAWLAANPQGWDGKNLFDSASEMLFGSQDYAYNFHKVYFDPDIVKALFVQAGFSDVTVVEYGDRKTDMLVDTKKPKANVLLADGLRKAAEENWSVEKIAEWLKSQSPPPVELAPTSAAVEKPQPVTIRDPTKPTCGKSGPNGVKCEKEVGHTGKHASTVE